MISKFKLELRDTPENRRKDKLLSPLEIAFDDPENELPLSYDGVNANFTYGDRLVVTFQLFKGQNT